MKYYDTKIEASPHLNRAVVEGATDSKDLDTLPLYCNEDDCFVTSNEFGIPDVESGVTNSK